MKRVLIVESYHLILSMWKAALKKIQIHVVGAVSLEEARSGFAANKGEFDAIVVCGCAEGAGPPTGNPNTLELVSEFRKTFKGPIIASSSIPEYREKLMAAGCDHECRTDKMHVPRLLKELLGV